MTGLIGILSLWILSSALGVGAAGFILDLCKVYVKWLYIVFEHYVRVGVNIYCPNKSLHLKCEYIK